MSQEIVPAGETSLTSLCGRPEEFPIVAAFPRSSSSYYATAVATARSASRYAEIMDGKKVSLHLAAFRASRQQFSFALALCRTLAGLRGVQIYANGVLQTNHGWRTIEVLECYLKSLIAEDWRAHCQVVVDNPFTATGEGPGGPYLLPCHYMYKWGTQGYALSRSHPSPMDQQIKASAVRIGCEWCPNFRPDEFRRIPRHSRQ